MRKQDEQDEWHPLGASVRPWPDAPRRGRGAPPRTPEREGHGAASDPVDPADRVAAAEASP
jgi:hypothetical protein